MIAHSAVPVPATASRSLTSPGAVRTFPRRKRRLTHLAQVAELVDALVSGTSGAIRGGSSPLLGTTPSRCAQLLAVGPQLLAVHPSYAGGGQEFLVGDPYQVTA